MGPRPVRRGNFRYSAHYFVDARQLQWGRVLLDAETVEALSLANTRACTLQWGRVLLDAETLET